jgi:multidrug efflux pump subunit AcrA (membrane-fusion protein)
MRARLRMPSRAAFTVPTAMRGRWLNVGLAIVLVGVIAAAYLMVGSTDSTTPVSTRTATVSRGSLTATVTGSGNLASSRTSALAFGASGKVTAVTVKVGDKVKKGQTLARIDTAAAKRTLKAARATLESAQASYDELADGQSSLEQQSARLQIESARLSVSSAKKDLADAKRQLTADTKVKAKSATLDKDENAVSQAQQKLVSAKAQMAQQKATAAKDAEGASDAELAQAEVNVQNAQVSVDEAEEAMDATKLTASFSGTVLTVAGEEGDDVSAGISSSAAGSSSGSSSATGTGTDAGSSTGTGSGTATGTGSGSSSSTSTSSTDTTSSSAAFITVASLSSLDVTASIAEADIGSLKVGQSAEVKLSAGDETMTGTVSAVSPEGTTTNNVVQYPVTISVEKPVASARLGASASVTITTGSVEDALILPASAVSTSGTRSTVALLKNGVATPTVIETGLKGGSSTEITSGLSEGDVVQIPTTTTSSSGVPGFGAGAPRGIGGGAGR